MPYVHCSIWILLCLLDLVILRNLCAYWYSYYIEIRLFYPNALVSAHLCLTVTIRVVSWPACILLLISFIGGQFLFKYSCIFLVHFVTTSNSVKSLYYDIGSIAVCFENESWQSYTDWRLKHLENESDSDVSEVEKERITHLIDKMTVSSTSAEINARRNFPQAEG